MANDSEKILFRLNHIIPKSLSLKIKENENIGKIDATDGPQEIFFQMTWGKIAAKIWGPVNGRPTFAICGWLDNCATFDTLIPLLPRNLRIVAVDTPGHGLSDAFPPDIAYNYLDAVLAIQRLSKQLGWDRFSLIGHSLGGCVSMLFAGIFPDQVEKLVMIDILRATPTITETVDVRLRKTVSKLLKYENVIIAGPEQPISYQEAVEKAVSGTFGSLDEKACDIMFKRGLKKVDGGFVYSRDRRLLAAPLSFTPKEDQLFLAKKVLADVLIIKFKDGPYFEREEDNMEHVEALKSGPSKLVKYVEIDGMHHAHLTHPERVAPLITDFFKDS